MPTAAVDRRLHFALKWMHEETFHLKTFGLPHSKNDTQFVQ
jgi:hypothetical protein